MFFAEFNRIPVRTYRGLVADEPILCRTPPTDKSNIMKANKERKCRVRINYGSVEICLRFPSSPMQTYRFVRNRFASCRTNDRVYFRFHSYERDGTFSKRTIRRRLRYMQMENLRQSEGKSFSVRFPVQRAEAGKDVPLLPRTVCRIISHRL